MNKHMQQPRKAEDIEEFIGGLLREPILYDEYRSKVTPELFGEYAWLYRIIQDTAEEEGLTFTGVAKRVDRMQLPFIQDLARAFFNANRMPKLLKSMRQRKLSQDVKSIVVEVNELLQMNEDPDEVLRSLQAGSMSLYSTESEEKESAAASVSKWADRIRAIKQDPSLAFGMLVGIREVDSITTGLHRKDFSVIGARTSMGKTAFIIELTLRMSQRGYKCAIFSLEMIRDQMYNRMMANLMQVSFEKFRLGMLADHYYTDVMGRYTGVLEGIHIDDTRGVGVNYIVDEMRRLKREQGLDFVVVDYLQDVKEAPVAGESNDGPLARVCRTLRQAAKDLDLHVMGLSQVKRAVEDRQDKRPGNSDLSGSTGIETSSDLIALLYRDEYYNPNTDLKNVLEVIITKQRNGRTGTVKLKYDKEIQRISDMDGR